MEKSNFTGLSPLWLISLAMVLGTMILTVIPISIATGDTIKSSDWIGFAGSVVAGVMTLIAAAIAWFAVQKQIGIQREIADSQAAIERFNILQSQLSILENETRMTSAIIIEAKWAAVPQNIFLAGPGLELWQVDAAIAEYEERKRGMEETEAEYMVAGTQRWAFDGGDTRMGVIQNLLPVKTDVITAIGVLKNAKAYHNAAFRSQDRAACLAINLNSSRDMLISFADRHLNTVGAEIRRLSGLMRVVRQQARL